MSKSLSRKERGCARVWWKVTTAGRVDSRLTTPVRSRAFLMRGSLPRGGFPIMATTRDELSEKLHRLSNYIECRMAELLPELICEGRIESVPGLAWSGCEFVES